MLKGRAFWGTWEEMHLLVEEISDQDVQGSV
jgi:hypothetical protein